MSGENVEEGGRKARDRKASKAPTFCPVIASNYCSIVLLDLVVSFRGLLVALLWSLVRAKRLESDRLEQAKAWSLPASLPTLSTLVLVYSLRLAASSSLCMSFR